MGDVLSRSTSVVLIGDSHLTDASSRPVRKLGPRLRAAGYDVATFAAGGLTTRAALEIPDPPDSNGWTVFCFGTNDAAPWKGVPLPEFAVNLQRLLHRRGGRQVVLGPPPVSAAASTAGRTRRRVEEYSAAAARVAAGYGAAFISLVDLLSDHDLADDGVHLNDRGYGRLAHWVLGVLQ